MTSSGLEMPPVQKAFQMASIWLRIAEESMGPTRTGQLCKEEIAVPETSTLRNCCLSSQILCLPGFFLAACGLDVSESQASGKGENGRLVRVANKSQKRGSAPVKNKEKEVVGNQRYVFF